MGQIQYDYVLIKEGQLGRDKCTDTEELEAENEVMHLRTKEHQRSPANHQELRERDAANSFS